MTDMSNWDLVTKVITLSNMHKSLKYLREDAKRVGFCHEIDDHILTLIEFVEFELDELEIDYS